MESLNVIGLECEEALAIVRMYSRKNKIPCEISSVSVPFYRLLLKWADATAHHIHPEVIPVQGNPWTVTIRAGRHHE